MVADQAYHFSFIFEDSLEKCLDSLHNKLIMWKPKSCPKALNLIGRLFFFFLERSTNLPFLVMFMNKQSHTAFKTLQSRLTKIELSEPYMAFRDIMINC